MKIFIFLITVLMCSQSYAASNKAYCRSFIWPTNLDKYNGKLLEGPKLELGGFMTESKEHGLRYWINNGTTNGISINFRHNGLHLSSDGDPNGITVLGYERNPDPEDKGPSFHFGCIEADSFNIVCSSDKEKVDNYTYFDPNELGRDLVPAPACQSQK